MGTPSRVRSTTSPRPTWSCVLSVGCSHTRSPVGLLRFSASSAWRVSRSHSLSLKRVVVPDAFRTTRLRPGCKFCSLGKLAVDLGWGYSDVVAKYEETRKAKGADYYAKAKAKKIAFDKASK